MPRPREVLDLLDLAHQQPGEQPGTARWRPVIGFPRLPRPPFLPRRSGSRNRQRSRDQFPGRVPCTQ